MNINEQVHYLRSLAADQTPEALYEVFGALNEAADTIEALSAKLQEKQVKMDGLPCNPGEKVWCVVRNEDEDYTDYSGYLFVGVCKDYALVCPKYIMCESFEDQLDEMYEDAIGYMHSDIVMIKREDVYMTEDEAKAGVGRVQQFGEINE